MNIIQELRGMGFRPGLRMEFGDGVFRTVAEEAGDVPPPIVYVLVDRNGSSVRTGRSLKQTILQREGATARGLNGLSTPRQNNKPVIKNLRQEIEKNGPLTSYVKKSNDATECEKWLFDHFRGRLDRRRG